MRTIPLLPVLFILFLGRTADDDDDSDDKTEKPGIAHCLVNGSMTLKLPMNWVAYEEPFTTGKLVVLSDATLKETQDPSDGAMGIFKIERLSDAGSPVDILIWKLYDEGGPPEGAEIEALDINGHPAARMSALDEMFGQEYLWYATVIQFDGGIIVYISFTGLGDYKENGIIDAVVETISVDSTAFQAAEKAG